MDEIDIIERNEALEKQSNDLQAQIAKLTEDLANTATANTELAEKITALEAGALEANEAKAALTADLEAARADAANAQAEIAVAKSQIEALKASQAEFDKAVAAKVAELGISSQAVGGDPNASEKPMSWTERARAAKQG